LSGIVGIFHPNGSPADKQQLRALAHFLSYCGPDAREVWSEGSVGFGHTLLRATRESLGERQPASMDGKLWITADVRLDCRVELETELEQAGRKFRKSIPDPELILHAYAAWGEDCVQHLRGDFAFAVWDARRRALFCARDHFGIKPFYYAETSSFFLFSNVLNCVRLHPDVSEELNDSAIADFLLFGLNCDSATTSFRDIRRLPPAHTLSVTFEGLKIARYWSPPTDSLIRYRHSHDYVEHFQVLLQAAVADRLRTDRVGILLSGGLDSGSVAAMAQELNSRSSGATDLRAYTVTYESAIAADDAELARKTAEFLRIPIRCLPMDHLEPFERWDDPAVRVAEPVDDPFFAGLFDQFQSIAVDSRVALSGEGADNLMHFQMWPYAQGLLRGGEWARFFADSSRYLRVRPSIWRGAARRIHGFFGKAANVPAFPKWIAPDLMRRLDLEARWRQWAQLPGPMTHPTLPKAHASLGLPQWSRMFEYSGPGVTHSPVEVRYPFLDLRVVNFLLALPPFPWIFEKTLLREAMCGRLPENVRVRPKTPLGRDPLMEKLRQSETAWKNDARWSEQTDSYVCRSALPALAPEANSELATSGIRPACLNFWLQTSRELRYNMQAEARNA
jgi:asparagine synthase (glutamine-hydrolysing)